MKSKNVIGVAMIAMFVLSAGVFAYQGYNGQQNFQNIDITEDVKNQIHDALNTRDYDAWVQLREETNAPLGRVSEIVTEENFDKFAEMHEAKLSGDFEKVWELKEEFGIERMGKGKGIGNGRGRGRMK
jgi:hypothetical protein